MSPSSSHARRLAEVQEAFRGLPERYLGAPEGFDATYQLRLGDLGRVFEVRCTAQAARVRVGSTASDPDVVISTDAETWLRLRAGELSGLDAFGQRRLAARGQMDLALAFEGLFRLPNGRGPLLRVHDVVPAHGVRMSVLTTGDGPDVLLLHGLGAAKTSFFDTIGPLVAAGYRVHAVDLPGFGSSAKPATAPYTADWMARCVLGLLDGLGVRQAHLVGNSMGGRVALEAALLAPDRVQSVVGLAPAVAFVRRGWHPVVQLLRPELGLLPHSLRRSLVAGRLWSMFADPDALDPAVADVAVDEFQRTYASPGARLAFLRAARQIYLDRPFGDGGFYPRLAELRPPALFVWGTHDPLIPAAFERHVARWLPGAGQVVLERCGHVPQIERSEAVAGLLLAHLDRLEQAAEAPNRAAAPARAA
jgi:pimeloyl-ACP methyl ester carboxylesterase/putative sterol carrier protein